MRKIRLVGLALTAAFAFCAIAAASAFATSPEWLVDSATVSSTAKVHVETTGTLLLTDLKTKVELSCTGGGLGLVWEKSDETEEATATSCVLDPGSAVCGTPRNAEAKHLPWLTGLQQVGTEVLDATKELNGKGAPGWSVICSGFLEDECSTNASAPVLENMLTEVPKDVLALFNQGSIATCTVGGANSGEVSGEILVAALEGLDLEIS